MKLKLILTTAIVGVALALPAASSAAPPPPPPTLSGESFHQDIPTITSGDCTAESLGFTYSATGTATGPYPGTFQETGSALSINDQSGHVISYDLTISFTIDSPLGRVTGTKHSTNFGTSCAVPVHCSGAAACDEFGAAFNTLPGGFFGTDTYEATIRTASGAFADNGRFSAVLYHVDALTDPRDHFDESFISDLNATVRLTPTTKDQCTNGGWQQFGFKNQGQCIAFVNHGP
jgi:hypothetical protein